MLLTRTDPFTQKVNERELPITAEEIRRWNNGALLQKVWPHLSADDREFINTGIMPDSWEHTTTSTSAEAEEQV